MAKWGKWTALVGGLIAVIAQFWNPLVWTAAIGGVVAIIGALGSE